MVRCTYKKRKHHHRRKVYGGSISDIADEIKAYVYKNKFSLGFAVIKQLPTIIWEIKNIPTKFVSLSKLFIGGEMEKFIDSIKSDALINSAFSIIKKVISSDSDGIKNLINKIFWEAIENVSTTSNMSVEIKSLKNDPEIKQFISLIITKLLDLIEKNNSLTELINNVMEKVKTASEQIPESTIQNIRQQGGSVDIDKIITKITNLIIDKKPEFKDKIIEMSNNIKPVLNSIIGEPSTNPSENTTKNDTNVTETTNPGSQTPVTTEIEGPQSPVTTEIEGPQSPVTTEIEDDNTEHLPIIESSTPDPNDNLDDKYAKCSIVEKITGFISGKLPKCLKNGSGGGTRKNKKRRTNTRRRSKPQKNISKKYKKH